MAEPIWMPYRDLAQRLGITVDGVRLRVKRHNLPTMLDNSGRRLVKVDPDALEAPKRSPQQDSPARGKILALEAELAAARSSLVQMDEMRQAALKMAADGNARADQADADRRAMQARVDELVGRIETAIERAAKAEGSAAATTADLARIQAERDDLRRRLEADRARSFWQRLLGRPL